MSEQVDGLTSKRAVCSIKGGVPSHQREASFTSRKRPLCLQTILFTPLSIRRGGGGEAVKERGERLLLPSFGGAWGGFITFLIHYL